MRINTQKYERAYGKKPRGAGCWAFEAAISREGSCLTEVYWAFGSYSEARQQAVRDAKATAKALGAVLDEVIVLP